MLRLVAPLRVSDRAESEEAYTRGEGAILISPEAGLEDARPAARL